jgi:predicted RNA-binding Zn-ribbon protein involved in translation (DUF1610 family)
MRKSVKTSSGIKALKENLIFAGQLPDIKGLKRELRKRGELPPKQLLKELAGQDKPMPPSNVSTKKSDEPIAMAEYGGLQEAFDFLNARLFDGKLPDAMFNYTRKPHMLGHFSEDRYSGRVVQFKKPEIALNPDSFIGRTDEQIVSTLAHEMKHLEQYRFGKPSARGYHNKEWAASMMPSNTGAVGGKETGQQMDHYIIPDGAFARAFAELAATGWKLNLQSTIHAGGEKKKDESKTKFTCPACGWIVRGKPDTEVAHIPCACKMLPERIADASYDQQAAE